MNSFTLELNSTERCTRIEAVQRFVGTDASGSFGILPRRAPLITRLHYGMAHFQCAEGPHQYLACPGALLYFRDNRLLISTRRYLISTDYHALCAELTGQLACEEENLAAIRHQLASLEQALLERMRHLPRSPA